jgi:VIT1/CCC1 family predicted Fe2+/Mn2+ transporter
MKKREVAVSERTLKAEDSYGLSKLCFATVMGLAAAVAAVFTTMLPLPAGWRYFWLAVCVASFVLAMTGVVLFSHRPTPESSATTGG